MPCPPLLQACTGPSCRCRKPFAVAVESTSAHASPDDASPAGVIPTPREILKWPPSLPCVQIRKPKKKEMLEIFIQHYCAIFGIPVAKAAFARVNLLKTPEVVSHVLRSHPPPRLCASIDSFDLDGCGTGRSQDHPSRRVLATQWVPEKVWWNNLRAPTVSYG